ATPAPGPWSRSSARSHRGTAPPPGPSGAARCRRLSSRQHRAFAPPGCPPPARLPRPAPAGPPQPRGPAGGGRGLLVRPGRPEPRAHIHLAAVGERLALNVECEPLDAVEFVHRARRVARRPQPLAAYAVELAPLQFGVAALGGTGRRGLDCDEVQLPFG